MLEEGRISPALASAALERHRSSGDRFEEALIDCGLPESMLLRHLAEMFNTRFISTKTLSGALVPKLTLQRLPRRLAERYQVVPIRFADDDVLTVVATEPSNPQLLESVRVAAGARLVTGLVARPAAILAAIAKLYGGETEAFAQILRTENGESHRNGAAPPPQQDGFADVQLDTSAFDNPNGSDNRGGFEHPGYENSAYDSSSYEARSSESSAFGGSHERASYEGAAGGSNGSGFDRGGYDDPSAPATDPGGLMPGYEAQSYEAPSYEAQSYEAQSYEAQSYEPLPPIDGPLPEPPPQPPLGAPAAWVPNSDPAPELDVGVARARSAALGDASKLAESLMIIHERTRGSLKSHSVRVARLSYSLCRQLDLSEAQAAQAWTIGLFHDLGKSQQNHLTALNVWQLEDYEVTARAQYKNPGRLLKNADVPETVLTAILHMYERFDGKGFPDSLAEEAIPFQSRVVALCDSVADLTLNPANTLGRIVSPLEACNHIRAQTPKVFDPTLLAHFSRLLVERKLDGAFLSDQSVHGIEKLLG
jgi:HD domain-containing protein/type II secretion system (T2SS) protein E